MQLSRITTLRYKDRLTEKRRKVFILKLLFFLSLAIAIIGFVLYLFFFSGFFDIKNTSISGLDKVSKERFKGELDRKLDSKWLNYFSYQKNLLFFNSGSFRTETLSVFPEIKDISVNKKLLHDLDIEVIERKTAGIWCFARLNFAEQNLGGFAAHSCKYFDEEGNIWGEAARSSGFLILNIDDKRRLDVPRVDPDLLADMIFISAKLKEINILISRFIIPENFIGDIRVLTSQNYELLFNIESDINEQISVLKIFLAKKQGDPPPIGGFHPQYIDLRISGRIYYR